MISNNLFKTIYKLDYNIFSISAYSDNKYLGSFIFNNNNNNNKITARLKFIHVLIKIYII